MEANNQALRLVRLDEIVDEDDKMQLFKLRNRLADCVFGSADDETPSLSSACQAIFNIKSCLYSTLYKTPEIGRHVNAMLVEELSHLNSRYRCTRFHNEDEPVNKALVDKIFAKSDVEILSYCTHMCLPFCEIEHFGQRLTQEEVTDKCISILMSHIPDDLKDSDKVKQCEFLNEIILHTISYTVLCCKILHHLAKLDLSGIDLDSQNDLKRRIIASGDFTRMLQSDLHEGLGDRMLERCILIIDMEDKIGPLFKNSLSGYDNELCNDLLKVVDTTMALFTDLKLVAEEAVVNLRDLRRGLEPVF